jgi:hypothetical protein
VVTVGVLTVDGKPSSSHHHQLDLHHRWRQAQSRPHSPSPTEEGMGIGEMEAREGRGTSGMEAREEMGEEPVGTSGV